VTDARSPNGARLYFLRRLPRDPMAADVSLPAAQTWSLRSYASQPDAPAPGRDVFDVHSGSRLVALDGSAYATW
jgi:general secretion pathway protein G